LAPLKPVGVKELGGFSTMSMESPKSVEILPTWQLGWEGDF